MSQTKDIMTLRDEQSCDATLASMVNLVNIVVERPKDPLFPKDHQRLVDTCFRWATGCWGNNVKVRESPSILWNVSDILLDPAFKTMWTNRAEFTAYVNILSTLLFINIVLLIYLRKFFIFIIYIYIYIYYICPKVYIY